MPTDLDSELRRIAAALVADPPPVPDWPLEVVERPDHRSRRWVVLAAAAMITVVGVVGVMFAVGRGSEQSPLDTTVDNSPPPTAAPLRPSLFPVVGEPGPEDRQVTATYSQTAPDNAPRLSALVARRDGDTLVDGIVVAAIQDADRDTFPLPGEPLTRWGRDATVFTEQGTPVLTTVVFPGSPALAYSGLDPIGFLDAAGPDVARADLVQATPGDLPFTLTLGDLPAGYEVITEPEPLALGGITAGIGVNTTTTSEGNLIEVSVDNPLGSMASAGPVTAVDVNGVGGWISDGPGHTLTWQVDEHTYALVGSDTARQATDLARQVEFVDEATWRQRYNVEAPVFPSPTPTSPVVLVGTAPATDVAVAGQTPPCSASTMTEPAGTLYLGGPATAQNLARPGLIFSLPASTDPADVAIAAVGTPVLGVDCSITGTHNTDGTINVTISPPAVPGEVHVTVRLAERLGAIGVTSVTGRTSLRIDRTGDIPVITLDGDLPASAATASVRFKKGDDVWERRVPATSGAAVELSVPAGETDRFPQADVEWVLLTLLDNDLRVVDIVGQTL